MYAEQHIGNLYRYVVADVIRRTFDYFGYDVTQVMNITDAGHITEADDDGVARIENAARSEHLSPLAIAEKYTRLFLEDRHKLNILDPDVMPNDSSKILPVA